MENHVERLAQDHERALDIATVLQEQSYVKKVETTETNIVIFHLSDSVSEDKFMNDLAQMNVRISNMGQGMLRIVTHLDYTDKMHHKFLNILAAY